MKNTKVEVVLKTGQVLKYYSDTDDAMVLRNWWMTALNGDRTKAVSFGRYAASVSNIDYVEVYP